MKGNDQSNPKGERSFNDIAQRIGFDLLLLDRVSGEHWTGQVEIASIKLRMGLGTAVETLVVFTGVDEDGTPVVAFHGGAPASEALVGGLRRLVNGTLRWKVDGYRVGEGQARQDQG